MLEVAVGAGSSLPRDLISSAYASSALFEGRQPPRRAFWSSATTPRGSCTSAVIELRICSPQMFQTAGAAEELFRVHHVRANGPEAPENVDTSGTVKRCRSTGATTKYLQKGDAGGGTRTPDTRIMIPLL